MLETFVTILVMKEVIALALVLLYGYVLLNVYCSDLLFKQGKPEPNTGREWLDVFLVATVSVYRYLYYKVTKYL